VGVGSGFAADVLAGQTVSFWVRAELGQHGPSGVPAVTWLIPGHDATIRPAVTLCIVARRAIVPLIAGDREEI
jgi:hypothetical protein